MPGFNPQQLAYRAKNANSTIVLVGDQPIAFAQTVNHSFSLGAELLYGIGNAKPQEAQQLRIAPEVTLDNFALTSLGNNIIQNGQSFASIVSNNQFTICIADGITGEAQYTYVGCVADNFNESIAANRPITDAIRFVALDVLDNTGISILNGPNAYVVPSAQGSAVQGGLGIAIASTL